jgi:hypothetical protein
LYKDYKKEGSFFTVFSAENEAAHSDTITGAQTVCADPVPKTKEKQPVTLLGFGC